MTLKNHLILASIALTAWAFFYLIGIPSNYFHDWSTVEQILLSLITFFAALPFIAFIAMVIVGQNYFKTGIWLAFYGSIPLALLDYIVCGIIQKAGFSIYVSHWYLTLGYFYVWIIGPLVGFSLNRFKKQIQNK